MNYTLSLLKIIGSPFSSHNEVLSLTNEEITALYSYAKKNKIGFTFLDALNNQGLLESSGLKLYYDQEKEKHSNQIRTVCRVSEIFNTYEIKYAVFKSLMPFSATPNDVDIIHFGNDSEYDRAGKSLLKSNYLEVRGEAEADAHQRMFHDIVLGGYVNPHKGKDIFDIDLYQRISASQILYLDKYKLEEHVSLTDISGSKVKVLCPEAELMAIIIHSIFPEMLCTLLAYFATLHYLKQMDSSEINKFISISKENNVTFSVNAHCSIVAELHKSAHGFIPDKVELILSKLNNATMEPKILAKNNFKTPHMYSLAAVSQVLLEKSKEPEFKWSIIKQILFMMNPKSAKWVIYNLISRRTRETY